MSAKFRDEISACFRDMPGLTRAPLGYLAERAPLGGGADSAPPPCLTQEREAVARWARWQTKALDEYFLSNKKQILKGHLSGQGQVKGQYRHFWPNRLLRRD